MRFATKAPTAVDLTDFTPKIKVRPNVEGTSFTVRCTIGRFDGIEVSFRRQGSTEWENAGRFARSPATISIIPTEAGRPEKISVRIRMSKGNDAVGQYSEVHEIVVG